MVYRVVNDFNFYWTAENSKTFHGFEAMRVEANEIVLYMRD